jgi:hypothetical protein
MPKLTRKVRKGHSFPAIRKKLDHIRETAMKKPDVEEFCKEWKKMFGKPIPKKLAKEYIDILHTQRGGFAPVGYEMRLPSGTTSTVPYVQSGFGFANIDSVAEGGPKEYLGSSAVPPDATNLVGGKRGKTRKGQSKGQKGGFQPFGASIPVTNAQALALNVIGRGTLSSPLPEVNKLRM